MLAPKGVVSNSQGNYSLTDVLNIVKNIISLLKLMELN